MSVMDIHLIRNGPDDSQSKLLAHIGTGADPGSPSMRACICSVSTAMKVDGWRGYARIPGISRSCLWKRIEAHHELP